MKNFEYWEKEIKKLAAKRCDIAIVNGKPCDCSKSSCRDCDFYKSGDECGCYDDDLISWLYEEHIEQPKISERTKRFFEVIQTGWVARDHGEDGELYFYSVKPVKRGDDLHWDYYGEDTYSSNLVPFNFLTLDFIKWEDEKPWSVEDIIKLEVEG